MQEIFHRIQELLSKSSEFKAEHLSSSRLIFLPTNQHLLESLTLFEQRDYLDFIKGRSLSSLETKIGSLIQDLDKALRTLKVIRSQLDLGNSTFARRNPSSDSRGTQNSPVESLYSVFLTAGNRSDSELYDRLLAQKIRLKNFKISQLERKISDAREHNSSAQLVFYLKNGNPYGRKYPYDRGSFRSVSADTGRPSQRDLIKKLEDAMAELAGKEASDHFARIYLEYLNRVKQELKFGLRADQKNLDFERRQVRIATDALGLSYEDFERKRDELANELAMKGGKLSFQRTDF